MTALRDDVETIFRAALRRVDAGNAIRASMNIRSDGNLSIGGDAVEIGRSGVYAIAIGKAAVGMIDATAEVLGQHFIAGIAVTKDELASRHSSVDVMRGAHPVPDDRSLAAGDVVLNFAARVPAGAVVVCLISGGGSALVESLREGVTLHELRDVTDRLLRAGVSIHELNAVRSRMSRIKAGGLLRTLSHARVYNLIVSDVLGDDLQTIASGSTVAASSSVPLPILDRYDLRYSLPEHLPSGSTPDPPTTIVANVSIAIDATAEAATALGYRPFVLTRSVDGEAREVGRLFASIVADTVRSLTGFGSRTCLLAGGETVVTVRGEGLGGRNSEAALAAAIRLTGVPNVAIGFLATDGDDGPTGAAGGIVDGTTVGADDRTTADAALANNDSFAYLTAQDAVLTTGPTGTNVNDLIIGLIG